MALGDSFDIDDVPTHKPATRVYIHNAPGHTPILAREVAYVSRRSSLLRQDNYLRPPGAASQPSPRIKDSRASLPPITHDKPSASSTKPIVDLSRTIATTLTAAEFIAESEKIRDRDLDDINLAFYETKARMDKMHDMYCAAAIKVFRLTKDIKFWSKERSHNLHRRKQINAKLAKLLHALTKEVKDAHHDRLALELKLTRELQERRLLEKETMKQRQTMAKRGYRAKDGTWKAIPLSAMLEPTINKEESMATNKIQERSNHT